MAEENKKGSSQKTENILSILGTVGGLAGPLLFGPEYAGTDLGAPFKAGAGLLKSKRDEQSLLDILSSNPATSDIIGLGQEAQDGGGLLQTLNQNAAGVPFTDTGAPDLQSPQFIQALAEGGFTKDALKFAFAKAQQKPVDPLDVFSKKLGIKQDIKEFDAFQTPEDKLADDVTLAEVKSKNKIEQKRLDNLEKDFPSAAQKSLNNIGQMEVKMNELENAFGEAGLDDRGGMDQLGDSIFQAVSGSTGGFGRVVMQNVKPGLFKVANTARDLQAAYVKSISGAQVSEKEFDRLALVLPNELDNKENFTRLLKNARAYNRYLSFSTAALNQGRNVEGAGFDRGQVELFTETQKLLRKNKLTDREEQMVLIGLQELGLEQLYKPKPQRK